MEPRDLFAFSVISSNFFFGISSLTILPIWGLHFPEISLGSPPDGDLFNAQTGTSDLSQRPFRIFCVFLIFIFW